MEFIIMSEVILDDHENVDRVENGPVNVYGSICSKLLALVLVFNIPQIMPVLWSIMMRIKHTAY